MPVLPLPTPDGGGGRGPDKVGGLLDAVVQGLGTPGVDALVSIHERWPDLVGEEVAAVSRPLGMTDGRLEVAVDGPAWADHLRWAEAEVVGRIDRLLPPGTVTGLRVRVSRRAPR
ncbi:MAG: DUF721 domain-containing protein [Acidimicrobiales bacterium]|nr:DUF721 domain-containing protein [Acidimicrobiales bacterium]